MKGHFAGMSSLPWGFCSGISLAERLPLIRSVKGNKALLLTKVTKEPAELAILLELLMFEKVPTQQR